MKKILLVTLLTLVFVTPGIVKAELTNDQQIASLLAQIANLQQQLQQILATQNSAVPSTNQGCLVFVNTLAMFSKDETTNGEVSKLQNFLRSRPEAKWPSNVPATGFFGLVTKKSLSNFQLHHLLTLGTYSSNAGVLDAQTREFIKNLTCGNGGTVTSFVTPNLQSLQLAVSKNSGPAPLSVTFTVTLKNLPSCTGVTWNFGDGNFAENTPDCVAGNNEIVSVRTFTQNHTYQSVGTYSASVSAGALFDLETIRVTSTTVVNPVAPKITFMSPSSGQVGTRVTLHGSGFTPTGNKIKFGSTNSQANLAYNINSSDGLTLTFDVPTTNYHECWNTNPACLVVAELLTPGTYPVSVLNSNGVSNSLLFIVTSSANNNSQVTMTANPSSGQAPLAVTFTIRYENVPYCSWSSWDFGDGTIATVSPSCAPQTGTSEPSTVSSEFSVSHTYESPGVYSAVYVMGGTESNRVTVTVNQNYTNPGGTVLTLGDLDADGAVSLVDVVMLRAHISGTTPLSDSALSRANLDTNTVVDLADFYLLRKVVLGPLALSDLPLRWGDINSDGLITVADTVLSNRLASGFTTELTNRAKVAADVDMNGAFTLADSKLITGAALGTVALPAVFGDLNGDYEVNLVDVVLLTRLLDNLTTPTSQQRFVGDVYFNGQLNSDDLSMLRQFVLGIITTLPVIP